MIFTRKAVIFCTVFIFLIGTFSPYDAFCLSIKKEEELSQEFMETVQRYFVLIRDPLITDYVERVGQRILSVIPPQPFNYHFYVIKEDSYNAFAGPGGLIFIHSGLFAAMESEEELAGILSHEIAHITNRHISKGMARSKNIGLATLAGLAAGILLGIGGIPTEAIAVGALAGAQSVSLAYSREDEMEADDSGLKYLLKAGYTGEGLLTMLQKMRSRQWFGPKQIPTYLTTHPALNERMMYIGSRLRSNPVPDEQLQKANQTGFQWANTKTVAMYGEEKSALRRFKTGVSEHPDSPLAHYGYGLILARIGHRKDAVHHFKIALGKKAFDPNILIDLGKVYFLDGQYRAALKILHGAIDLAPDNSDARFFLGRVQIEMEMFLEAESTFKSILKKRDDFVEAFYYLGEAYGKQGKLGKAHYNLGRYYKKKKNLKNAVFHLQRALKNTDDPDEKHEIEEMIEEIQGKMESASRNQQGQQGRNVKLEN